MFITLEIESRVFGEVARKSRPFKSARPKTKERDLSPVMLFILSLTPVKKFVI